MSLPSRSTLSPTSITDRFTTSAIASGEADSGSSLWRITATAAERYMAPVSRWARPRRPATARATVDFPEPTGPSMATTVTPDSVMTGSPPLVTPYRPRTPGSS